MGLISFFKSPERGIYLVCIVFGMLTYLLFRPAIWAPYAAMMVTYHLFLLYILYGSDYELRRSYNLPITIIGHMVCVILLAVSNLIVKFGLRTLLHSLPFIGTVFVMMWSWKAVAVIQFLITYGLATYERDFLFAGEQEKYAKKDSPVRRTPVSAAATPDGAALVLATGLDHHEWLLDRERRKTVIYAHGTSAEHDFEQWLRARGKTQYATTQSATE